MTTVNEKKEEQERSNSSERGQNMSIYGNRRTGYGREREKSRHVEHEN